MFVCVCVCCFLVQNTGDPVLRQKYSRRLLTRGARSPGQAAAVKENGEEAAEDDDGDEENPWSELS